MLIDEPDELLEELEDKLSEYFKISREAGPIPTDACDDLSSREKLHRFYAALRYAERKLDESQINIENQKELAERLDVSHDSVKKAHQILREEDVLVKDGDRPFKHKITDYGLDRLVNPEA